MCVCVCVRACKIALTGGHDGIGSCELRQIHDLLVLATLPVVAALPPLLVPARGGRIRRLDDFRPELDEGVVPVADHVAVAAVHDGVFVVVVVQVVVLSVLTVSG